MTTDAGVPAGLREQNKIRTRRALSAAALELATESGYDALTAERIAERAQVSRRTFFNYFNRVEDALLDGCAELADVTLAAFRARPVGESLADSVRVVIAEVISHPAFDRAFALERLAAVSAAADRVLMEFHRSQQETVEQALSDRFGPDAEPLYVVTLAACIAGLIQRVGRLVVEENPAGVDRAALHERFSRAFALFFAGFPDAAARADR